MQFAEKRSQQRIAAIGGHAGKNLIRFQAGEAADRKDLDGIRCDLYGDGRRVEVVAVSDGIDDGFT